MSLSADSLKSMNRTRRIIFLLVAVAVLLPYFVKFSLPYTPTPSARTLYDKIDSLGPGAHVLISADYDPSAQAELTPMLEAVLRHCFHKKLVPVVMTHWITGLDMVNNVIKRVADEESKGLGREIVSGRDYVFLGFKPGGDQLLLNMGESIKGAFTKDFYGMPTVAMPALEGVTSLRDIKMVVDLAAGATVGMWVAYGSDRFGFPLGVGTTAVQAPDVYPFLNSKQIVGLLGGLRGAADYEMLADVPGEATRRMLPQSTTHLLIIVLILIANARLLLFQRGANARKD